MTGNFVTAVGTIKVIFSPGLMSKPTTVKMPTADEVLGVSSSTATPTEAADVELQVEGRAAFKNQWQRTLVQVWQHMRSVYSSYNCCLKNRGFILVRFLASQRAPLRNSICYGLLVDVFVLFLRYVVDL